MKLRIAYLHGLEANNKSSKNEWLKLNFELFGPQINYRKPKVYQDLKNEIINFNPNILIGSSMGGFFGYELAKELNVPAILFNPALHSIDFTPDMTGHKAGDYKPSMYFVFGEKDTLIDPLKTLSIIEKESYTKKDCVFLTHGHKTPYDIFVKETQNYIEKNSPLVSENTNK